MRPFHFPFSTLIILVLCGLVLAGCDSGLPLATDSDAGADDPAGVSLALPAAPFNYAQAVIPAHVRPQTNAEDNTPVDNPVTNAGATLGRVLFYDTLLSANETISCASCHQQQHGFSDPNAFSTGFDGGLTGRNAMSAANVRFYESGRMFWDERSPTLEAQALEPIQHPVEMGLTLDQLVDRVESADYYVALFTDAFGDPTVTAERIADAIAQFERSIISFTSKWDDARQGQTTPPGQPLAGLTAEENRGLELFFSGRTQCSTCHRGDLFVGDQPRNNGLDATTTDEGAGNGRFKAPSLRNIALTGPYMHDGRFETLRDVVEFYNDGIQNHPNLDNRLERGGQPIRMNLNNEEIDALVAFMETLTETGLATMERFSNPFVR